MREELVDGELLKGIGEPTDQALADAARLMRRTYALDRWLNKGRSRAPVAVVIESDLHAKRSRRLVLKVIVSANFRAGRSAQLGSGMLRL